MTPPPTLKVATVHGTRIAYRDRGNPDGQALLLLHGFPGSSDTFTPLLDQLTPKLRLIAPDYPWFGASGDPDRPATFDRLTEYIELLLHELNVDKFTLYMFDFGGPVGMRLLERYAGRVIGMIFQNANIYASGLGPGFAGLRDYWEAPDLVRPRLRPALLSAQGITGQCMAGAVRRQLLNGTVIARAIEDHAEPSRQEAVLDLLFDYQHNVTAYPQWQGLVAKLDVPVLAVWGEHDPIFTVDGALGLAGHARRLRTELLDAGHFAALEQPARVADAVNQFFENPPEERADG